MYEYRGKEPTEARGMRGTARGQEQGREERAGEDTAKVSHTANESKEGRAGGRSYGQRGEPNSDKSSSESDSDSNSNGRQARETRPEAEEEERKDVDIISRLGEDIGRA